MARRERTEKIKPTKAENVTLFNEPAADWGYRYRHRGNFIWGVILIVVGLVFLLNTLGLVSWQVWDHIWYFWPVLLILWGIKVILGRNVMSRIIVNILTLVILILILLFAIVQANPALKNNLPGGINQILNMMEVNSR